MTSTRGRASQPARPRLTPAAASKPNSGLRTALQKHVDFFDSNQDGRITLAETYDGLRRLGINALRSASFAAVINAALGPVTSRTLTLSIDTARIHLARHGSDTGVYDSRGRFSPVRFNTLFDRHDADGDGALDAGELTQVFSRNRTDLMGHLGSRAEFGLLLELAGEKRKGRLVLTRERLELFYNGSLFYKLAQEVRARKAQAGRRRRESTAPRDGTLVAPLRH